MPKYYFETSDDVSTYLDPEGEDFADDQSARVAALDGLADLLSDAVPQSAPGAEFWVQVSDAAGTVFFRASARLEVWTSAR